MSTLSLRLPDSIHSRAKLLAKEEHVSINQLISTAVAEKLSALETESYLDLRSNRASKNKFKQAMASVPSAKPLRGDEL